MVFCLGLLRTPVASASPAATGSESEHLFSSFSLCPELLEAKQPSQAAAFSLSTSVVPDDKAAVDSAAGPKPRKHIGRAWLELGAFMLYSGGSYNIRYTKGGFAEDWDFKFTWHDQLRRFFTLEAWHFDSNNFKLNWTHSVAGGIYYQLSRTNNLSWLQSWLMSVAGSSFWEYVVEWHEVVSINDQIMTGLGGYSIGESWYALSRYLSYQSNVIFKALSFINPINKFNRWLDRKDPAEQNYIPPGWHDFNLFMGARSLSTAGQAAQTGATIGLDTQIMELPEYGNSGQVDETVKDTYFSRIYIDYTRRGRYADETNIMTDVRSWAYVRQNINDNLEGYNLSIGLGSSFEYFKKRPVDPYDYNPVSVAAPISVLDLERPRDFTDKLALVHIAGPVLDWTLFRRGLKFRSVTAAYFDFGLINSFALNEYSALHDLAGMKTTVLYYGYYYGFGGSFSEKADLEWGNFRARGLASFGAWGSADFLDRWPDRVTNNAHLGDNRTRCLIGTGYKIPRVPLQLFVNYEEIRRWGKIQEVRVDGLEKRLFAGLSFLF